jgi:hypothetical protein
VRRLSWTCALPTHIHTILVWHIATTICEVMSPQEPLTGDRLVAKRLSDYCAYLVAFVPGMVPGHSYDTRGMFDAVVMEARNYFAGRECDTLRGRCVKLLELTSGRSSCCFPRHRATPRSTARGGSHGRRGSSSPIYGRCSSMPAFWSATLPPLLRPTLREED